MDGEFVRTEYDEKIFHYTTFDNFKSIMETKELWISSTSRIRLKDKKEFYYDIDNLIIDLNRLPEYSHLLDGIETSHLNSNMVAMKKKTYALSFSKTPDNNSQWDRYAGNDGICLEFHKDQFINLVSLNGSNITFFGDVNYVEDDTSILLKKAIETLPNKNTLSNFHLALVGRLRIHGFIKNKSKYESEDEVRFVICESLFNEYIKNSGFDSYINDYITKVLSDKGNYEETQLFPLNIYSLCSRVFKTPFLRVFYNNRRKEQEIKNLLIKNKMSCIPIQFVNLD